MAKHDLDLRMGIDSKLYGAKLETGALSYAVDTSNLYIDALTQDKNTERQMINSNKAYFIRNENEEIIASAGIGRYSFQSGNYLKNKYNITIKEQIGIGYECEIFDFDDTLQELELSNSVVEINKSTYKVLNYEKISNINGVLNVIIYFEFTGIPSGKGQIYFYGSLGKYSFSTGLFTKAYGKGSVAEGSYTQAIGDYSHAQGISTLALGEGSHAQGGLLTQAVGKYSFAGGENTSTIGDNSFSYGQRIINKDNNCTVIGQYNKISSQWKDYIDYESTTYSVAFGTTGFLKGGDEHTLYAYADYDLVEGGKILPKNKIFASFNVNEPDSISNLDILIGKIVAEANSPDIVTEPKETVEIYDSINTSEYKTRQSKIPGSYLFAIGNGLDNSNRSNAFIVDIFGNACFENNLLVKDNLRCDKKISSNKLSSYEAEIQELSVNNIITDVNISGNLTVENLNVSNEIQSKSLNVTENITINGDNVITQTILDETKDGIMDEVQEIADSIITKVWHRGPEPPQTIKEKDLLWIRYDGTTTYGNGVLYFLNPTYVNDPNLTDAQVKEKTNWIPMSAIYT